jgi:hypothetical protein
MSEPDAVALPREGEVFFDVRGEARSMRLSWYADSAVAVFSIWQGNRCTATFRLPFADLARMVDTLESGPAAHAGPAFSGHSAERSYEGGRSDPGYGDQELPAYGTAATAYLEQGGYESRRDYESEHGYVPGYQTGSGYDAAAHYGAEQGYQSAAHGSGQNYRSAQGYGSGQDYGSGYDYRPEQDYHNGSARGYGTEPDYGEYPHHERATFQRYREDQYHNAGPAADQASTAPRYARPGYHDAERNRPDTLSSPLDTAPYVAGPEHLTDESYPDAPAYRRDRDQVGTPASAPAYPGKSGQARFPADSVTTEHAEPDWGAATAAYRDR